MPKTRSNGPNIAPRSDHAVDVVPGFAEPATTTSNNIVLVNRCLNGEAAAWSELYQQCHDSLCNSVKSLLTRHCRDADVVDEIASRVWYAVVRDNAELLRSFNPRLDVQLTTFFRGLARLEVIQYLRAEHRRRNREAQFGRKPDANTALSSGQVDLMLSDFTTTLTPSEQSFLQGFLLSPTDDANDPHCKSLSDANIWQRRHRIRSKLQSFLSRKES